MPSFYLTAKAVGFLASRRNVFGHLIKRAKSDTPLAKIDRFRGVRSFAGVGTPSLQKLIDPRKEEDIPSPGSLYRKAVQTRRFLGCGDGEEGNMLSKVHEERLVLGYSPEQLFDVVAAVDLYQGFVPWCQRSDILKQYPDGSFDAELEIGFKFLVESYISHVELERPKFVKSTVSQSSLFDHLINIWEFHPGPTPGSCNVHFLVDFKFQSPFYRQLAGMFFKEVVSKLVGSFTERCKLIYGPGVRVLESTYEHKA